MNNKIEEVLAQLGWVMECEHPLEISHAEKEAFASREAASRVILDLMKEVAYVVLSTKRDAWLKKPAGEIHDALDLSKEEYLLWANHQVISTYRIDTLLSEFLKAPALYLDDL